MKLYIIFYFLMLMGLGVFLGCKKSFSFPHRVDSSETTCLNIRAMPELMPAELKRQLAWGLWHLDKSSISTALIKGVNPYALGAVVDDQGVLSQGEQLSPYAIILEGYLAYTYLEENVAKIYSALDQVFVCIDFLIKKNISVDYGIITLGSKPSMRGFVKESLTRLYAEKCSQGSLDDEGKYALYILERIQTLINIYQPDVS